MSRDRLDRLVQCLPHGTRRYLPKYVDAISQQNLLPVRLLALSESRPNKKWSKWFSNFPSVLIDSSIRGERFIDM